jgi:LPXTG-motif cell wall-anchored protein
MTQGRQGGSVLSFVVIGGVLILLLLGGVYFVRQRTSVEAANQPTPAPTSDQSKTESDKPKEDQPVKEEKKEESSSETKSSTDSSSSNTTTALPQTGPIETVTLLLVPALLTGTFAAYIRSRREFSSL